MKYVLDASAVLTLIKREPGHDRVAPMFAEGTCEVSAVNWAEVLTKLSESGQSDTTVRAAAHALGATVIAFDTSQAETCGLLRTATRRFGLSLGDRACLALARQQGAVAVTADRIWLPLAEPLDIVIECIRPDSH